LNILLLIFRLLFVVALTSPLSSLLAEPVQRELAVDSNSPLGFKMLPVDHPNNAADQNGLGKVETNFLIAKFDTTAEQYCPFLNAVETMRAHGFYHPEMGSDPSVKCISQSLAEDGIHFIYKIIDGREKFPITYVSWIDAVCFCNWLHHGCPTGNQLIEEFLYSGAYLFSKNGESLIIEQMPEARYFLPGRNQLHKATFYRPQIDTYWNYPTMSLDPFPPGNTIGSSANQANYYYNSYFWGKSHSTKEPPYVTPVGSFSGSPGPFGTYDMGANVKNWSSDFDSEGNALAEGGSWKTTYEMLRNNAPSTPLDPTMGYDDVGFRIAAAETLISESFTTDQDAKNHLQATSTFIKNTGTLIICHILPEIVEAIAYQKLKLFFLIPYVTVMGSEIIYEQIQKNYIYANSLIAHMLWDTAFVLADQIFNFDLAWAIGDLLDYCGLTFIKNAFVSFHNRIDDLIHWLGLPHSHGEMVQNEESWIEMVQTDFNSKSSVAPPTPVRATPSFKRACADPGCTTTHANPIGFFQSLGVYVPDE
jgi:hypothetical protein